MVNAPRHIRQWWYTPHLDRHGCGRIILLLVDSLLLLQWNMRRSVVPKSFWLTVTRTKPNDPCRSKKPLVVSGWKVQRSLRQRTSERIQENEETEVQVRACRHYKPLMFPKFHGTQLATTTDECNSQPQQQQLQVWNAKGLQGQRYLPTSCRTSLAAARAQTGLLLWNELSWSLEGRTVEAVPNRRA